MSEGWVNHEDATYNEVVGEGPRFGLPEELATPEARAAHAQKMENEAQRRMQNVDVSQFRQFDPTPGTNSELVYYRNMHPGSIHVSDPDYFIPGGAQYQLDEPPFLVMERAALDRSPQIKKLTRTKVGGEPVLKERTEEEYYVELEEWQERQKEMLADFTNRVLKPTNDGGREEDEKKTMSYEAVNHGKVVF